MELVAVAKENIGKETIVGPKHWLWLLEEQQALLLLHAGTVSCVLGDTRGKQSTGTCQADPTLSEKQIQDGVLGNDLPDWYSPRLP